MSGPTRASSRVSSYTAGWSRRYFGSGVILATGFIVSEHSISELAFSAICSRVGLITNSTCWSQPPTS